MNEKLLKALIAAGLAPGLAATFAAITKEVKDDEIEATVKTIVDGAQTVTQQSEIDRRVTQAVKTAIENYEKKHNLKDGKPIEEPTDPTKNLSANGTQNQNQNQNQGANAGNDNPLLLELTKVLKGLTEEVQGLKQKTAKEERQAKVRKMLTDAKIPEIAQKRFSIKDDATDEEIQNEITSFKQELIDLGLSSLKEPGKGTGKDMEVQLAEQLAKQRNDSSIVPAGTVPPKKL